MSFLHTLFLIGTELVDKNSQVLDGSRVTTHEQCMVP